MSTLESTPPQPPQPSRPADPPDPVPEEPGPITIPPSETNPHDSPPGGAVNRIDIDGPQDRPLKIASPDAPGG